MSETRRELRRTREREQHTERAAKGRAGGTLELVGRIAVWSAFAMVMVVVAATVVIPRLMGAVPLAVLTSSMEPTMPPGTLVVSKPVDPASLAVGDVITFQPVSDNPMLITHRIVGQAHKADGALSFTTRGDNNGTEDEPIIEGQVMGKVIYSVPYVGYVTTWLDREQRGWMVGAFGALLISYAVFTIMRQMLRKERT
ncbi:signal peptidase [Arthrobacter pigmenti]|uniref:Signal peptidase I n=1 Tax=Arthrobacter pigmenti TaxID=271432 RepID=A0A846RLW2_9MICC|nr:signal peptidase I [Arthrobacter pigmenti]NJC24388.1 signal peptidase [Arthrobacter pigmenti]